MPDEPDDDEMSIDVPASTGQLGERSPHATEQLVLAVRRASCADEVAAALDAAEWLLARAKTVSELAKRIAIDWIEHNGDFTIGDVRYSVGYATTVRCSDPRGCGHELLKVLAGDFDAYLQMLARSRTSTAPSARSSTCRSTARSSRRSRPPA